MTKLAELSLQQEAAVLEAALCKLGDYDRFVIEGLVDEIIAGVKEKRKITGFSRIDSLELLARMGQTVYAGYCTREEMLGGQDESI